MARIAHLDVFRAGNLRIRRDQIGRLQQAAAIVALVAARTLKLAVRARPLDIAVGQETRIID